MKGKGGNFEKQYLGGGGRERGEKEERKWMEILVAGFEIEWSVIPSGWLVEWVRNIVATYE